jgi:predicted amidohydrolase YtcJ
MIFRITYFFKRIFFLFSMLFSVHSYSQKSNADLLVYNATVYTVDPGFAIAEAIAVKDGKIIGIGKSTELLSLYDAKEKLDAHRKFIYPGFIDAHAHFLGYGTSLQQVDLVGTRSWDEVIQKVEHFKKEKNIQPGEWILGRGWDQNDWKVEKFPTKDELDKHFPQNPVLLERVDGHGAIANQKAIDIAGIKPGQKISGGDIETVNGMLTGIFIDNAIGLIWRKVPPLTSAKKKQALLDAQQNCFTVGLTTVDECGLNFSDVYFIDDLQKKGELKMRMYIMLNDTKMNYDFLFAKGKIKTDKLNVRSFKVYADGALGSRGACLLQPYSDRAGWSGFLLSSPQHFDSVANIIYSKGFQMCTHAIGDSGNRIMLNVYAKYLKNKNDLRWRIEHAQVVNENDFRLFGDYNIIPSVQPTHATSDMYWAGDRLGKERVKGAYAYKQLLDQNGWIPLGTDFPVEDISPFKTFYAAVFRRDSKGFPKGGYQMENALSREETLKGMTIWAAKANFEENEKGSLEPGKFADFIILDKDLMKAQPTEILKMSVRMTYLNGEKVYQRDGKRETADGKRQK